MSATPLAHGYGLPPTLRALVDGFQARRARTTADRSLAMRIRDGIGRLDDVPSGLSFQIHDGAVSVYGIVPTPAQREAVITVAATQPGVRRIVDHLTVADA